MELGSVWGHGNYVAPDWTADSLHREAVFNLDRWAKDEFSKEFAELDSEMQSQLSGRLATLLRTNPYEATKQTVTIDPQRAEAFEANLAHCLDVFEYVDLGRGWQIALFVGLLLRLFLVIRVLRPALQKEGDQKQLVALLAVSTDAIALFYGAGLTWGQYTNLSIVEYWRRWVVHLWVEGFFEVFATTVIAFIFMRLNLIRPGIAAAAALLSATIFLYGGIIDTIFFFRAVALLLFIAGLKTGHSFKRSS